jgi:hypothetical protein
MGYLSGSVIGIYVAAANEQKRRTGFVEPAQRLFRQPQT